MSTYIKTLTEGNNQVLPRTRTEAIKHGTYDLNTVIDTINSKIPSEATSSNKLADKSYVSTNYVAKESGKGLSSNDYTTAEKNKLGDIESGAQVNSVTSVAGRTGAVTLAKSDVGLGNVDNTSDASKPISTATQNALNTKENTSNKVTSLTSASTNNQYPGAKVVYDELSALKQNIDELGLSVINGILYDSWEVQ